MGRTAVVRGRRSIGCLRPPCLKPPTNKDPGHGLIGHGSFTHPVVVRRSKGDLAVRVRVERKGPSTHMSSP